ncbi:hypothetical protein EYF80_063159 [Liparis tanakae]|uniref:Uncharacterized protein n=1 Tax=Liparis tanakae TaxID=230148 RepID=A0A4Z2ED91_9TELE|nr:hypothetical protein EYF80_063159 [Liparis tanakae]
MERVTPAARFLWQHSLRSVSMAMARQFTSSLTGG